MLLLKIDNPEIESIFLTKFNANKDEFIDFIQKTLMELEDKQEFSFSKQNPRENFHYMEHIEKEHDIAVSNPFLEVEDTVSFAKTLRENAYR